jgi:protein-L-isoaspartate(D-aspartate) O-methyltransferase
MIFKRTTSLLTGLAPVFAMLIGMAMTDLAMAQALDKDPFTADRLSMVDRQILARGIEEENVLDAMRSVPRHLFVPEDLRDQAYVDFPQRIGSGQTISQPYIVALMTALLNLEGGEKVLEIGTGSGYQAAVLSKMGAMVYTIEIREELAEQARETLTRLEYANIHYRTGDGYQGWPEEAPFDAIVVTAAPPEIPERLVEQLKVGGRLVIPVGRYFQDLMVVTKREDGVKKQRVAAVRFVPMVTDLE